jgi:Flp pilus assembly protein TadG
VNITDIVRRFRADERGAGYLAAFIVLFAVLTLGGIGVIVDSARMMSAQRDASSAAYEAARAGAQAVRLGTARGGGATLDPDAARTAAMQAADVLLAGTDAVVSEIKVSVDEVAVTVTRHVDPYFPVISARTVTETGRARILAGITQEGQ